MSNKNLKQTENKQAAPCLNDVVDQEANTPASRTSRTALATKNAAFGLAGQAINLLMAFASRTVFI